MIFKNVLLCTSFLCLTVVPLPIYSMTPMNGEAYLYSCKEGHLAAVKRYIQNGGDKNYTDHEDKNACQTAAIGGHLNILKYLVEQKCDEGLNKMYTPFHIAAECGHIAIVRWYVHDRKINVNLHDDSGITPLQVAFTSKNALEIARFLLNIKTININQPNSIGLFPVHYAIEYGHLEGLKLLLENGAYLNVQCKGTSLVHFAAKNNWLKIIQFLVDEKKMDLDTRTTPDGQTPFHIAASCGGLEVGKWLKLKGADIKAINNHNENAFVLACRYGNISFAKILLPFVNVNAYFGTCCKQTVLYEAAKNGNFEVVQFLLDNGAEDTWETSFCKTNLQGYEHCKTASDIAHYYRRQEIVEYLKKVKLAKSVAQELLHENDAEESIKHEINKSKVGNKNSKKKRKKKKSGIAVPAKTQKIVPEEVVDLQIADSATILRSITVYDANKQFTDIAHLRNDKPNFKQTFIDLYKSSVIGMFTLDPQNKDILIPLSPSVDNVGSTMTKNFLANARYSPHVEEKEALHNDHHHNFTRTIDKNYGNWARVIVCDFKHDSSKKRYWEKELGAENVKTFWFELRGTIFANISLKKHTEENLKNAQPMGYIEYIVLAENLSDNGKKWVIHRFFNKLT